MTTIPIQPGDEFVCLTLRGGKLEVSQPSTVRATGAKPTYIIPENERPMTFPVKRDITYKLLPHEFSDGGTRYSMEHLYPGGTIMSLPCIRFPESNPHYYCRVQDLPAAIQYLREQFIAACNQTEESLQETARTVHAIAGVCAKEMAETNRGRVARVEAAND